jgi:hypothetical protein
LSTLTSGSLEQPAELSPAHFAARRRFFRLWLFPFLIFGILTSLWSIATPLGASPDAPEHIARAVSVDRGEWLGTSVPGKGNGAYTRITVPRTYAEIAITPNCYELKPTVSAACIPKINESSATVSVTDYVGRYPPLYYLIVGIPSLLTDRVVGVQLMGIVSAWLCAAFIALAIATARRWSRSPLLSAAIVVAATPMCLFLAGTVNPSGLEICSAIAVWTAAAVAVSGDLGTMPPALRRVLYGSAAVFVLSRSDSLFWLPVIAGILAPLWFGKLRSKHYRRFAMPRVSVSMGLFIAAVACAIAWIIWAHGLRVVPDTVPANHTLLRGISDRVGEFPRLIAEEIGIFGWLDTPAPWLTMMLWYCFGAVVICAGMVTGQRRGLISIGLAVSAAFLAPIATTAVSYNSVGLVGQGRYFLPGVVGVPIVALSCWKSTTGVLVPTRRLKLGLGVLVAFAQFVAYYFTLRRYRVGTNGPIFGNGTLPASRVWSPPLGTLTVDIAFLVASCGIVWIVGGITGGPAHLAYGDAGVSYRESSDLDSKSDTPGCTRDSLDAALVGSENFDVQPNMVDSSTASTAGWTKDLAAGEDPGDLEP